MRLLLDEMWPPFAAIELRSRGHDVVAVAERDDLRSKRDPFIFAAAQREGRVIVTEDHSGFRPLATDALESAGSQAGLILTSARALGRHREASFHRLITALDALLSSDIDLTEREYWLR